ncbi:MAG: HlyD family efflux transporter periplasmic adaptor subunit [Clostridia bacterium]|nr:HlyD family efflux transporter periplasmic adaptor subunit [Clostridia bacterium]
MKAKNLITNSANWIKSSPKKAVGFFKDFKSYSKKKKIIIITALVLAIILIIAGINSSKNKSAMAPAFTEARVEKQDITSSITGSAVVNPKDQYSITALVSGDVLTANFEQGDIVEEGDILYEIDASDAQNTIENSDISYQRSQLDYDKALKNYNDLNIKSTISGVVKNLYVKVGDSVNAGVKIADIYDDSYLTLTLTFNDADAQNIYIGQNADVRISSNGEMLSGTVTSVNQSGYASVGNTLVRTVKIKVKNPGVLTNTETATATVGGYSCSSSGTFEYLSEKTITANTSGEIDALYVMQGSRVSNGTVLAHIDSSAVSDNLKSSKLSLKSAQLSRDNAQKKLEDYTITAPISGTVVMKNVKAGDKLDNSTMSTEMAVIYDMSSLECELSVDELDIKNVKIGQNVIITSDAVAGKRYNGQVTNVSVNGTTSGGVTTYPVNIEILDFDEDLLPGMNIDVEIITSKVTDVLAVSVSAVNRGNIVYVKGEKTDENDNAPDGFKSVKVETGVNNNQYIEIKSGLKEGDIVYVPQVQSSGNENPMAAMMGSMGNRMPTGGMQSGGMQSGGGMPSGNRGGMR